VGKLLAASTSTWVATTSQKLVRRDQVRRSERAVACDRRERAITFVVAVIMLVLLEQTDLS
jgi:hypothetical protein